MTSLDKKEASGTQELEFSHVGTVVEGPTEYYSARMPKKPLRKTFLYEVVTQEAKTGHLKRKYAEIRYTKTSGKRGYYNTLGGKRPKDNKNSHLTHRLLYIRRRDYETPRPL